MWKSLLQLTLMLVCLPRAARAADDVKVTPDVVYGHKLGLAMTLDVIQPPENQRNGAGVAFMVSGGWYSQWVPPQQLMGFFQPLLDEGFTVFAVRHGSSPRFKVPEAVEDVRRSIRFLRAHAGDYGIDPNRLGVFGASAGGHLSLVLGTTGDDGNASADDLIERQSSRVAAVVAYFPPTDLREMVKPESPYYKNFPALHFDPEQAPAVSPLLQVTPDDAPSLMIHGDQDTLVPISHSEQIVAAFKTHSVQHELIVIPGAAHGFQGADREVAERALVRWFQTHLLPQAEN